jgi:hypothetical protein
MCRNIKPLFNFEPPATDLEVRDASRQFVRKLSGVTVPSKVNEAAFERAIDEISVSAMTLIQSLVTTKLSKPEPALQKGSACERDRQVIESRLNGTLVRKGHWAGMHVVDRWMRIAQCFSAGMNRHKSQMSPARTAEPPWSNSIVPCRTRHIDGQGLSVEALGYYRKKAATPPFKML